MLAYVYTGPDSDILVLYRMVYLTRHSSLVTHAPTHSSLLASRSSVAVTLVRGASNSNTGNTLVLVGAYGHGYGGDDGGASANSG